VIRQITAVAIKELQLLWQDRPALAVLFLMPAFFIVVMSLALQNVFEAGTRDRPIQVLVVDEDDGPIAARLLRALERAPEIVAITETDGLPLDREKAEGLVAARKSPMALILPVGLSKSSTRTEPGETVALLIVDPATQRQLVAPARGAIEGALRSIVLLERLPRELRELVSEWSVEEGEEVPPAEVLDDLEQSYSDRIRRLDRSPRRLVETRFPNGLQPERRPTATQQSVPAYTIFGVFFITLTLSTSFVRERAGGTTTRLRVTPLSRSAILLGKLLPYGLVNLIQIAAMFAVGVALFDIELGDPAALLVLSVALASCASGLGLLVAAVGRSEAQVSALAVAVSLIFAALGGLMVPSYVMPGPMRVLAVATPHAWALQGYHDVMLRGGGIQSVIPEFAILIAFATALFGAAALCFRVR
jgi:ABC-2 type transport system permease protein